MRKYISGSVVLLLVSFMLVSFCSPEWGFYGHRKINRMAVFTLPTDMIKFFKENIEFLTEHAVDPDKRRYATKFEAIRHYIDIDHWGDKPFETVPKNLVDAVMKFGNYQYVEGDDTLNLKLFGDNDKLVLADENDKPYSDEFAFDDLKEKIGLTIRDEYYEGQWEVNVLDFGPGAASKLGRRGTMTLIDEFSSYGILPYHLEQYYYTMVKAFENKDENRILRLCAEMGHYIGDAHVPLHTTENYNGQMTNQVGIHGFWESRIPELFADETYDFFVGKASYIENKNKYFWGIISKSHSLLDSVLSIEKRLSIEYPEDKQFCYDERLERSVRIQCPEYAGAYEQEMKGMVEDRMQASIQSIGSVWYSAWIDAGQPDLAIKEELTLTEEEQKEQDKLNQSYRQGAIFGREH